MTIIAQDPSVTVDDKVMLAQVRVPAERLDPGPRSHRFHVVDYDATTATLHPPADLVDRDGPGPAGWAYVDRFAGRFGRRLLGDFGFHAQNTYAIAACTLASFERGLGRRIPWGFTSPQLFLVPHAFAEANAYYSREDRALYFGYVPGPDGTVYTCLSHDIVAHETTHAVLDGLRPRFVEPGLPDQAAFHEALADIVALLSVFSVETVVQELLGSADAEGRIPADRLSERALHGNALSSLAEELGQVVTGERGEALRRSARMPPNTDWKEQRAFELPHRRGEVVVAAVMHTLIAMWRDRLRPLIHAGALDRARAAEEGSKAANHLLGMVARSIDYTPPVELEFADVVDAIIVADTELVPDDRHAYRDALSDAFAGFGITRPNRPIADLTGDAHHLDYHNINAAALRADREEIYHFIWQNADILGIDHHQYLQVGAVRPSVRSGPDGLVVSEVIADYVQMLEGPARNLAPLGLELPAGMDDTTQIQLWGGGVLVFDQFGRAKLHQSKPIGDWDRQSRRLEFLWRTGQSDANGRFGYSLGVRQGQHFAELHHTPANAEEQW